MKYFLAALFTATAISATAQTVFKDNFNQGASQLWGNQSGKWTTDQDGYKAKDTFAGNLSSLPFNVTNFVVEVDVHKIADGGIWLRTDADAKNGVVLITGGDGWGWGGHGWPAGRGLYWQTKRDGNYSPILNRANDLFTPEVSDAHLRIEVVGNVYSAYLNGSETPVTSFTNSMFESGRVGLYDFSVQSFANFTLTVQPSVPPTYTPATPPTTTASAIVQPAVKPGAPVTTTANWAGTARPETLAVVSPVAAPAPNVSIFTAVEITWPAVPGAVYQAQWSPSAGAPNWSNLGGPVQATGTNVSVFDSTRGTDHKFYRVEVFSAQ